jgi:ribonuclease Z
LAAPAEAPKPEDRTAMAKKLGVESLEFSEFIADGAWDDVDDVLRGIYKEASEALGREFPYPEKK